MAQIFLKFANVKHNWKIQRLKIFLNNSGKVGTLFGKVEKLARLWHVGTPSCKIGTSARWHITMSRWHAFGTLAIGHVDHASAHDTWLGKLSLQ